MRFDLVIFDNDGVLVDSEPIACDVLAGLLTRYGLQTKFDDVVREYLGGSLSRTRSRAEARLGRPLPADFEEQFHRGLFERFSSELHATTGADEALDRLDALDVEYCVASSGTHDRIRQSLTVTGLIDRFDGTIFSTSDVTRGKPAPDLFLFAAEQMGVDRTRCVVIEDSPLGIEAARRASMASVGYSALQSAENLAGASEGILHNLRALPDLLVGI